MAAVCFFVDIEMGHLLPTLGIAISLLKRGHQVSYIGVADHKEMVTRYGLRYFTVYEDIYPRGCLETSRKALRQHKKINNPGKPHLQTIMDGQLNHIFELCKPDLLVVSSFLSIEALLLQRLYQTKIVLFTPYLPDAKNSDVCMDDMLHLTAGQASKLINFLSSNIQKPVGALKDLFLPVDGFPELIACPAELYEPGFEIRQNAHYIEASVRPPLSGAADHLFQKIPATKSIVYVSMGSQTTLFPEKVNHSIDLLLETVRHGIFNQWVFIISTGPDYPGTNITLPENVLMNEWVPQVEVLQHAQMAIIHGGLGAIKECIYYGVPMIIYPLMRDGPANGRRVAFHGVGITLDFEHLEPKELMEKMNFIFHNIVIKENIQRFKNIFHQYQQRESGTMEIEKILTSAI